jgi:thiamine-monophosphate kinase
MTKPNKEITTLSELGEFAFIERLTKNITLHHKSSVKGVGDDAAVISYGDKYLVITTDMLMEGIHFNLIYTPMMHLGYKAAVVNFSDVYAMNAVPRQMVVSIAISQKFSVEAIEEFYSGLQLACQKYKVDLVGGDTSASITGMAISITVIGEVEKDRITYRSTAHENDLICVSGDLGAAYLGLQVLEREKKIFEESKGAQPKLEGYDYVLQRQLKPEARVNIIDFFKVNNIVPASMIDISDGLASELRHICFQSGKGCSIYQEKIPISELTVLTAKEFNLEPMICALNGGEDYELLFTCSLEHYDILAKNNEISIIGHISGIESGCKLITELNQEIPLIAQGWS